MTAAQAAPAPPPSSETSAHDARLAVIISWIAAAISLLLATAIPTGYYLLAVEAEQREATVAARLHATFIMQVIQAEGADWRVDVKDLIDSDLAPSELPESRVIHDAAGLTVARNGAPTPAPVLHVTAPLLGREGPVGQVGITRSLRPIVTRTALVGLLSLTLAAAIFLTLRTLPLRALRRTLAQLRTQEARARLEAERNLQLVFENAIEGILVFSPVAGVLSCNAAAARMFGRPPDALTGAALDMVLLPLAHDRHDRFPIGQFESTGLRADASRFPVEVTVSESGVAGPARRIAIVRDITDRKTTEERLSRMANYDSLTGLPNRSAFLERLAQAIGRSARSGRMLALMFLDIDRFKTINDSLGHDIGDQLLVAVAGRLAGCVRGRERIGVAEGGQPATLVYRLGGDEFTIVLEDIHEAGNAATVAQRVLQALSRPIVIGEHELFISASIGITVRPDGETDLENLVKQADIAMYHAKSQGRDTFAFYNAELDAAAGERHMLETSLRQAFERGEFRLVYQPKADLATGAITGVEALLRWSRPDGSPVGPAKFIPILEETGLIVPVGAWAMRSACAQLVDWDRRGLPPLKMAVNLSARQFRQDDLTDHIAAILAENGLAPDRLEIELTESTLIEDTATVSRIMANLGALGVAIAIDDFGTGHSSLSYLKRFDVDTLKIDRSFVRDTPDDPEDNAIAIAVIALAHGLGLRAVAEGVEKTAQADFLRRHGCDEIQGYLLSPPLDPDGLESWLRGRLQADGAAAPAREAVA